MRDLIRICAPTSAAKYVEMETLQDPRSMPGLRLSIIDWPYREGLAMAEAMNELAFIATGMYGKNLPKQDGAPIRLVVPWKYGFKSIKSIVRVNFTDKQPVNSWQQTQPGEYGFWANVNPAVPHPRWSQATERVLGTDERVPTVIYNGYGAQVASLYAGMPTDKLFM
jgi:sulfoxide reductase catalytic subunit YedY